MDRPARAPVLRVNQLDARRLDAEVCTLLRQQLTGISLWRSGPARLLERLQPELDLLLQAVLWRYTVWADAPTPGGALQNLRYARARGGGSAPEPLRPGQKVALLAVQAALPWLAVRLEGAARALEGGGSLAAGLGGAWRDRLQSFARWYYRSVAPRASMLYAVCAAANFLVFLREGVFSHLSDRLLGVRLVHIDPAARRQVAFEYMNRVMIWNGLSEFLMTIVPLVNLARLRQSATRRLFPKAMLQSMEAGAEQACGLCGASPMSLPMRSDCGHMFCYFCIASERMENPRHVACPRCSSHIEHIEHAL